MALRASIVWLLASLLTASPASAWGGPACSDVTEVYPAVEGSYAEPTGVPGTHPAIRWWTESNGVEGLQKVACLADDGSARPADARDGETSTGDLARVSGGCVILFGGELRVCLV